MPTAASTDATASPSASPTLTATPLPGGLHERPLLPDLVDGEAAACIPTCGAGRVAGGELPTGRYQTKVFFGGYMTVESDGSWPLSEDSNGELSLLVSDNYRIAFMLDIQLLTDDGVADVTLRAAAYVRWLRKHPELIVSQPMTTTIGSTPAIAVDIALAPNAGQDADDCAPEACVVFFRNPLFGHGDGVLGDDVYRMYFADVTYSGSDHLLFVKVEGRDEADLQSVLARTDPILATVMIPAHPTREKVW